MARRIPTHPRIEHAISDSETVIWDSTEASPELRRRFDDASDASVARILDKLRDMGFKVYDDKPGSRR